MLISPSDPVEKAIRKFQKHPSISIITKMISSVKNETTIIHKIFETNSGFHVK